MRTHEDPGNETRQARASGEQGWALLGVLLALTIMSIFLASSVAPNVKTSVQREKEEEMLFRGDQIAKAIARYYNGGNLLGIQLMVPPPYGYLTELKKLRDGITVGTREIKLVRPSAVLDPFSNEEWEPVRARDPRIMNYLQHYAAETGLQIPQQYLLIAGPPAKLITNKPAEPTTPQQPQQPATPNNRVGAQNPDGDDDDDDDDEDLNDPLAHLFESHSSTPGLSSAPIVGVAPKVKGRALHPLYGLENYEEWVFIYVPDVRLQLPPGRAPRQPGQPQAPPARQPGDLR